MSCWSGCFYSSLIRRMALLGLLLFPWMLAWATQNGTVKAQVARVHQYPNATSPVVGKLTQGRRVRMSSDLTRDIHKVYWYKVELGPGEYGYVRVSDVMGEQLEDELRKAGLSKPVPRVGQQDIHDEELPERR